MSQQSSPQVLIERLREATSRGDWDAIDPILGEINRDFKPELVAPLLSTLVENKLFEEPMYGIVHLAEDAPGPDFVHGLLAGTSATGMLNGKSIKVTSVQLIQVDQ